MNEEIATRARKLINLRGKWDSDLGLGLHLFVGEFLLVTCTRSYLVITTRQFPPRKVYGQEKPGMWGKLLCPEHADDLLDTLRKEMLLEDLAGV